MFKTFRFVFLCALMAFFSSQLFSQGTVEGTVIDEQTDEPIFSANVLVKGSTRGVSTDFDGKFSLQVESLPAVISISFIGYKQKEITVQEYRKDLVVKLVPDQVIMEAAEVVGERISERQKQAPLTVESLDVIAIKEAPSGNFYESLGNLKGVDITSASLAFKVINTRGFNSTSPVRSLQLIDGVDNQSPGLNFSLGNFLGASDLDLMRVDIIAGASSAFYGPGAFNGVINMTTKDPFQFPGFAFQMKMGERALFEQSFRLAEVIKDEEGNDKFAVKVNFFWMKANDWEATNDNPTIDSEHGKDNPGGYDAVNRYGDEDLVGGNSYDLSPSQRLEYPGLGTFYRTGYWESDVVNYNTNNLKTNVGFYYKPTDETVLNYTLNYSTGNTIYQGDNRYALRGIQFWQNKIEFKKEDQFFIRAYSTQEDAGDTYDAVVTAFEMQNEAKGTRNWNTDYSTYWKQVIVDMIEQLPGYGDIEDQYPRPQFNDFDSAEEFAAAYQAWIPVFNDAVANLLAQYPDQLQAFHDMARDNADNQVALLSNHPLYEPGTPEFERQFNSVTSRYFNEGGSRFYDRSALYHVHGEYEFHPDWLDIKIGGNTRWYRPDSRGTIFSDTLEYQYQNGEPIDSAYRQIKNFEYGVYLGLEKEFLEDRLKTNFSIRMDKNQNFDYLFSPALSAVYTADKNNIFRATFSSAIRNPTLADQYLFYDVGRAILLGNVDGIYAAGNDSLVTVESFGDYLNSPSLSEGVSKLEYFNVPAIRPEKVKTIELGYRGTLFEQLYIDWATYFSWYDDFIGYNIGIDLTLDNQTSFPSSVQVYRLAANARDRVTTMGTSLGLNYYFKRYTLSGNYSFNRLDLQGSDDPIIPAFNTPEHKFNLGLSGRDMTWGNWKGMGFGVNYKWVDGFVFAGSPQFTGFVPSYDMVDFQVNKKLEKYNATIKLGASNVFGIKPLFEGGPDAVKNALDNRVMQVFGGPFIGRLAYFSILFEIDKK
ncbi:carboxypeptidase-like regulatory domain-containing protein [Halocola ammonii]